MKTYFIQSKITAGNSLIPRLQIIATNTNLTYNGFQVIGTENAHSKQQALKAFIPKHLLPMDYEVSGKN